MVTPCGLVVSGPLEGPLMEVTHVWSHAILRNGNVACVPYCPNLFKIEFDIPCLSFQNES